MTREDAIEIIKFYDSVIYKPPKIKEALEMAIEDMEKQIPKKPNNFDCGDEHSMCPNCRFDLGYRVLCEDAVRYCWKCGQALDWREENV